ncbi:MAG: hypothetical protein PHC50_08730 [Candidatus Cloacimonetes bacterium]|nr:hypothetical protein [Candidatus Cloacimonadota bacterium]
MKFTVSFSSGTVKVIDAHDWLKTVGAAGVWDDATSISTNTELDVGDHEIIIVQDDQVFRVKLSVGSSEYNKGIFIPVGFDSIVVKSINGTVKRLKYDKQTYASTIDNTYSNSSSITVSTNDILLAGDTIALNENSDITLEFSLGSFNIYMKTGFDVIGLSNEI